MNHDQDDPQLRYHRVHSGALSDDVLSFAFGATTHLSSRLRGTCKYGDLQVELWCTSFVALNDKAGDPLA